MQNRIDLDFADGCYTFALPLPRIDELQRKTGVGIGALFARLMKGCSRLGDDMMLAPTQAEFYAIDLVEVIRQGLIGGDHAIVNGQEIKVSAALAAKLIDNYVLTKPLMDNWSLAASIIGACVIGYEPPKKGEPAEEPAATNGTIQRAG